MPHLSPPPLTAGSPLTTTARMKPTALTPSPPGAPSPLPPPHKLELQTLKLEELTVSVGSNSQAGPLPRWVPTGLTPQPLPHRRPRSLDAQSLVSKCPAPAPACAPEPSQQGLFPPPPPQVSELRQQLRLRGLPVSGTKSMLLERMRSGALPRERPKPRREDGPAGAPWPRLRPKALGAVRRQGSVRAGLRAYGPVRRRQSGTGREVD